MHKLAVVVLLLAACKSEEDYKKQKPPEPEVVTPAERKPPPPPKKELKPEEMGQCTLKLTGAMKKEQTSMGGRAATNVSYWLTEAESNNMMGVDGFVVRCEGPDIKFAIMPGGGKKDGMPFAPKKYEFKKGTGTDASVMVTLGPTLTFGDASGSVNITAFDKRHIAGTIDLSGQLKGKGASGAVKLEGQFDFVCPGFSGCELQLERAVGTPFSYETVFDASNKTAVLAAYFDDDHLAAQDKVAQLSDRTVVESHDDSAVRRCVWRVRSQRPLPVFVRPFVDGGRLTYLETMTWRKADDEIDMSIVPQILGGRVHIDALYRLAEVGPGKLRRRYSGTITVNLKLLSGKIERAIADEMAKSMPMMTECTQRWLTAAGI